MAYRTHNAKEAMTALWSAATCRSFFRRATCRDAKSFGTPVFRFRRRVTGRESGNKLPHFKALLLAALSVLIVLCTGCGGDKPRANAKDFSKTNRVCVLLGEGQQEHGNGLEHIHWEKDGLTTATNFDGIACRHLKLESGSMGYLYFTIDPSFKKRNVKNVKIEVEYLDVAGGTFGVQYDGRKEVYEWSTQEVSLRGSLNWLTATFMISGAKFRNRQNSKADFRLWVGAPEFYVRRVMITRN